MSKDRSIKNHDRTVSMANDANTNMIVVSQIQKNDRLREEVLLNIRRRILFGVFEENFELTP